MQLSHSTTFAGIELEGQVASAQVVTVPGTQQSYTLSGLTPGTYFVQVRISNEINYQMRSIIGKCTII